MLRETLFAFRRLGALRLCLLFALALGADALLFYLETTGSGVWMVLSVMISHMVTRATALDQPLFRTDGKGNFPHMGRYVLANLWVYGLALLAMIPGMSGAFTLLYMGILTPTELIIPMSLGVVLPLLGILAVFGTALPAAAMGAPYGVSAALAGTGGQRRELFGALLLGPGAFNIGNLLLVLSMSEGASDPVMGMIWVGLGNLLSTLSLILTATILAVAWRRRQPVTPLAEVFA